MATAIAPANTITTQNPLTVSNSNSTTNSIFVESGYDYILSINLMSIPTISNNITNIFTNASFMQNTLNTNDVQINLTIALSTNFPNWNSTFNNKNLITFLHGSSTVGFSTLNPNSLEKIGDRLLEIVAHKLFGNGHASAAISNDLDFYNYDSIIWNHLSITTAMNSFSHDVYNQYIALGRYNQPVTPIANTWIPFNFINLNFDYPMYLIGSVGLDNSLTTLEKAIFSNGPNVGGTQLINSMYNVPLIIRFHT
jgi:hypothetical protein